MSTLLHDLRFALRAFSRAPRFTVPAVLALALGIGATAATFSVVRGVMLRPLPYQDPDRIVTIWESHLGRNRPRNVIGPANFVAWLERSRSFEHLGMVGPSRLSLVLDGQPEEVVGWSASSAVFPALGVAPAIGRAYTAEEDLAGSDLVIVVSHEFWQSRLGGHASVLGTTLVTNGRPRTIVGVMPPGFTMIGQRADYLVPYGWTIAQLRNAAGRGSSHGIARLRDGVTIEQASADMAGLAAALEQEAPQRNAGWSVTLVPVHEQMIEQIRPALYVLSGAVALVLLIACVNVANLLLARSTVRQRELGLRTALGAGRGRLLRQLLSESLVLGAAGAVVGLVLAALFHRGLLALVATRIPVPRLDQVTLDGPVLLFTAGLSLVTSFIFGLLPAVVSIGTAGDVLRDGGRHGSGPRARRALGMLVVAEVAISLMLLVGAGLLIRSFIRLQSIDPGFRADHLLTARVQVPGARYVDARRAAGFYTNTLERLRVLPGVESAAAVSFLPLSGPGIATSFHRADQPEPAAGTAPTTDVRPVTPGFFRTMGIPQLAGRDFDGSETEDSPPVAVISETLARRHLAGEPPIGARLHVNIGRAGGTTYEIIGVVGDIKIASLEGDVRPAVYVPHTQLSIGVMSFVVRTAIDPAGLAAGLTGAVRAIDPELPVADVRVMEDVVDATLARPRVVTILLAAFAVMALALAAVGVYGVMAYSVGHRTQEIGVRMALGATPESVFRLVIGQALTLVGLGVALGLAGAAASSRVLGTLLYQTATVDPTTFAVTAVVLTIVAGLASYVPARRGTRIAPVDALRTE